MTLQELQNAVRDDWQTHNKREPDLSMQLLYFIEEFGEVAEAIRKREHTGDRAGKQAKPTDLGAEMADLMISLATLANHFDVDLTAELEGFWKRLAERRMPPSLLA